MDDPDEVGSAWDEAFAGQRPCVVVSKTDPAVPPIPPNATWDQMTAAASSILKGDPDALSMITEGGKAKLGEVLPTHGGS